MQYLYHMIPNPMEGTNLIPLNSMDKDSELYKRHVKKYEGREDLMDAIIPKLDCKWNDVVQFSALDPQLIVNELREIQDDFKLNRCDYYKVSVDQILSNYQAVCYDRNTSRRKGTFDIIESEVKELDKDYVELQSVPVETKKYWKKVKNEGGKYLWFPFITHILVKGIIDTKGFEICTLK